MSHYVASEPGTSPKVISAARSAREERSSTLTTPFTAQSRSIPSSALSASASLIPSSALNGIGLDSTRFLPAQNWLSCNILSFQHHLAQSRYQCRWQRDLLF